MLFWRAGCLSAMSVRLSAGDRGWPCSTKLLQAKDIQAVSQRLHLGAQRPKPRQRQTGLDHQICNRQEYSGLQHYGLMMSDSPGVSKRMLHQGVTSRFDATNDPQMRCSAQDNVVPRQSFADLDRWMERYQQADPEAPAVLVGAISPALLRFFRSQVASREHADDLLQETWLRIHRVRHTYRPGEPVLPWIYAIARRVRVDGYRRTRRITLHEIAMELLPERPV